MERQLNAVEDSLERFRQANRDWAASSDPEIVKHQARLQRNVEVQANTFLFLNQQFQTTKLDAQKDIPIIRILDEPTLPTIKSWPRRGVALVVVFTVSLLLASGAVVLHESLRRRVTGSGRSSYAAFRNDIKQTFPRVTRLTGKRGREEAARI